MKELCKKREWLILYSLPIISKIQDINLSTITNCTKNLNKYLSTYCYKFYIYLQKKIISNQDIEKNSFRKLHILTMDNCQTKSTKQYKLS